MGEKTGTESARASNKSKRRNAGIPTAKAQVLRFMAFSPSVKSTQISFANI